MLTAEKLSWIREQIEKTGKVAPVELDKLMERLLGVLNRELTDELLNESGLKELLKRHEADQKARLDARFDREFAEERKDLKAEFDSKAHQLQLESSQRVREAEYAESVVESLETILGFIFRVWDSLRGEKEE